MRIVSASLYYEVENRMGLTMIKGKGEVCNDEAGK